GDSERRPTRTERDGSSRVAGAGAHRAALPGEAATAALPIGKGPCVCAGSFEWYDFEDSGECGDREQRRETALASVRGRGCGAWPRLGSCHRVASKACPGGAAYFHASVVPSRRGDS